MRSLLNISAIAGLLALAGCGGEGSNVEIDSPICGWPSTYCDEETGTLVNCGGIGVKRYPCDDHCADVGRVSPGCVDIDEENDKGWKAECVCQAPSP